MSERTPVEWRREIATDLGIVRAHMDTLTETDAIREDRVKAYAMMRKELRRALSDTGRMAKAEGIAEKEIDAVPT